MQRCHTYKIALKMYFKSTGGRVGGGQDGCERRIKDFVKIQKKKMGGGSGRREVGLGGGSG